MSDDGNDKPPEKSLEERKLDLEYLKVLFDRESKENDRMLTRNNVFMLTSGVFVAAYVGLMKQSEVSGQRLILAMSAFVVSLLWYQMIIQAKKSQFSRQQDAAKFIVEHGLKNIFDAESYSIENPDKIPPAIPKLASSHILAVLAGCSAIVWALVGFAAVLT